MTCFRTGKLGPGRWVTRCGFCSWRGIGPKLGSRPLSALFRELLSVHSWASYFSLIAFFTTILIPGSLYSVVERRNQRERLTLILDSYCQLPQVTHEDSFPWPEFNKKPTDISFRVFIGLWLTIFLSSYSIAYLCMHSVKPVFCPTKPNYYIVLFLLTSI